MKIKIQQGKLEKFAGDLIVVNLFQGIKQSGAGTGAVNRVLGGLITKMIKEEGFEGKEGEMMIIPTFGKIKAKKILLLGMGQQEKFDLDAVRRVTAVSVKKARELKMRRVGTILHGAGVGGLSTEQAAQALTEGALLGGYTFLKYKSGEDKYKAKFPAEIIIIDHGDKGKIKAIESGVKLGTVYTAATNYARDLVNEPSSKMFPKTLAEEAVKIAGAAEETMSRVAPAAEIWSRGAAPGISVKVYEQKEIEKMGMGGLLGVAKGSDHLPYFVHLVWKPELKNFKTKKQKNLKKVALVGKSITFDSGGLSLKTAEGMTSMKIDMAGGAAILGIFHALKRLKPNIEAHGILPICENMPSGRSLKPGDVLKTMSGKTIEVLNTDAEGRIILADGLYYASRLKPDFIIDLATLTGACVVALGEEVAGVMGSDRFLLDMIEGAAVRSGEKIWELPLIEEYRQFIKKSPVADLTNITMPKIGGGAITAGLFLHEFVGKIPWAHIDIAGPAWAEKDVVPYVQRGGSGFGVRMGLELIRQLSQQ